HRVRRRRDRHDRDGLDRHRVGGGVLDLRHGGRAREHEPLRLPVAAALLPRLPRRHLGRDRPHDLHLRRLQAAHGARVRLREGRQGRGTRGLLWRGRPRGREADPRRLRLRRRGRARAPEGRPRHVRGSGDDAVTYEEFQRLVAEMVDEVPPEFMRGLQGVHVLPQAKPEEGFDEDVYRMGEYLDPGPDSFLGGPEGLGRHVALYYGSFRAIAEADPDFDWEEEAWETLTHELRHHVESLAGEDLLVQEDVERGREFGRRER